MTCRLASILFFTFQYGYILIEVQNVVDVTFGDFTFQYGYILINTLKEYLINCLQLYIPIWLYSNQAPKKPLTKLSKLYIPIWLYSNTIIFVFSAYPVVFTFQYGYILILMTVISVMKISLFTFQYGYILITSIISFVIGQIALHSNMVIF